MILVSVHNYSLAESDDLFTRFPILLKSFLNSFFYYRFRYGGFPWNLNQFCFRFCYSNTKLMNTARIIKSPCI